MSKKFLRTDTGKYKRLGKGRKKLQRWRKPRGRDNKIREKIRGKPVKVSIGFRTKKSERGKINGKIPVIIKNLKEIENMKKDDLIIISGKLGKKKRIELEKKLKEKGHKILNLKTGKNESKK